MATAQEGVVALWQLVKLGMPASTARGRVAAGSLHRVHHGVYAVGHAHLTRRARIIAAVLACGPGAVASHRTAAGLHELRMRRRGWIDVTSPGRRGRGRAGIRVHDMSALAAHDVTTIDGIPCTTLSRTLLDVAADATAREIERATDRAEELRLLDLRAIDDVLTRANGHRGAAVLRAVLSEHRVGSTPTRNELEEAFLAVCATVDRPPDRVNAWIAFPDGGGAEADFLWSARRLICEVDGRAVHATRRAFEHDRRRDQRLALLGWRVVRFSWRQVMREPSAAATTLRGLLA